MSVSIIVPNYNHARYLPQRLDSILNQTYQDFELIVLDDASTDSSREILSEYKEREPRISISFNDKNSGNPFHQWNAGAAKAKGKYLWIAESDDFCDTFLLEKLHRILENNPDVGIAYCGTTLVDEEGAELKQLQWMEQNGSERWQHDFINNGLQECREHLIFGNTIPNASGVVFRRELFEQVGGVDEAFRFAGDWLLWSRILLHADVAYVAEKMNYQRYHEQSVMSQRAKDPLHFLEYHRVREDIKRHVSISHEVQRVCRADFARDFVSSLLREDGTFDAKRIYSHFSAARKTLPQISLSDWLSVLLHFFRRVVRKFS